MQRSAAPGTPVSRPLERSVRGCVDAVYTSTVAAPGQVASAAEVVREETRAAFASLPARLAVVLVPVLSIAAALGLWELVVRRGLISEQDLPTMSATVRELWSMMETRGFWVAFGETVRGWALGLGIATALAVPIGIFLEIGRAHV